MKPGRDIQTLLNVEGKRCKAQKGWAEGERGRRK
jgi:hypothetical protein